MGVESFELHEVPTERDVHDEARSSRNELAEKIEKDRKKQKRSSMIELGGIDEVSKANFINPTDINDLQAFVDQYPGVKFYSYENRVGNYKTVLIIELEGKKYVMKSTEGWGMKDNYPDRYSEIWEKENRPSARFIKLNGHGYGLFEFVGDQTVDWSNRDHLSQVVNLGVQSFKRNTSFDPNKGNFVVRDGKMYYVDKSLEYMNDDNPILCLMLNLYHTLKHVEYTEAYDEKYLELFLEVIEMYEVQLKKEGISFSKEDIEGSLGKMVLESALRHVLNDIDDEKTKKKIESMAKNLIEGLMK
ncbi:hypothetical protein HOG17_04340 [Candidatus Peregrinibacteria bacterium]|jgi:hypothetical protein|nr:hypothetical protein [Candidatus Peregrinibacteria bacterium]MBT4148461.1 hypothetical protein [Candidatus Peregrinibacteria bacterium]MBT4366532.1 hypothetical protein [Candidatus Peregrinibacteria bacterium]MBT4456502.1 hypothetical protein [Candidatus Peregrinibacteria bacterium]